MLRVSLPTTWFPDNAIMRAERSHQERALSTQGKWRRKIQVAINGFMLTIGMILFWGEFVGALTKRDPAPIGEKLGILTMVFIAFAIVWHFSLMLRTLALASNSINREQRSGSWELLVLTGIDARQIVCGKWWATIQHQFPHYVYLALLRTCAATYWAAVNMRMTLSSMYTPYYSGTVAPISPPEPIGFLVAGIVIFILTMTNLCFTAACGVLASAQRQTPTSALIWAIVARLAVPLMPLILFAGLVCNFVRYANAAFSIVGGTGLTLIDNGVSVIYGLVTVKYEWSSTLNTVSPPIMMLQIFIIVMLVLLVYALLTFFLLRQAESIIVNKSGASPPETAINSYTYPVIP